MRVWALPSALSTDQRLPRRGEGSRERLPSARVHVNFAHCHRRPGNRYTTPTAQMKVRHVLGTVGPHGADSASTLKTVMFGIWKLGPRVSRCWAVQTVHVRPFWIGEDCAIERSPLLIVDLHMTRAPSRSTCRRLPGSKQKEEISGA